MPSYWMLKNLVKDAEERKRVAKNLVHLRKALAKELPARSAATSLLLGTWNIRNFDDNRFGHGPRLAESFFYLAETIAAFDLIAVQELCEDLRPFDKLMDIVGPKYDFILTDITEGPSGNKERLGFIYNRDKISFRGIAGEIVLPFAKQISDVTKERQFARTPFCCHFQAGWFKFMLATVHIYFGKPTKTAPQYRRRVKEIEAIAEFLSRRADKESANYILVGDFNIEELDGDTFDALAENGFEVFANKRGSNAKQNKFYDQISFKEREDEVRLVARESGDSHGVVNLFDIVFRANQFEEYDGEVQKTLKKNKAKAERAAARITDPEKLAKKQKAIAELDALLADATERKEYYRNEWRTYQISDHFPLWVDLQIDFADDYLTKL